MAAMHHNENAGRMQAVTVDGLPQFRIYYAKYKAGKPTVRITKTNPTYGENKCKEKIFHLI